MTFRRPRARRLYFASIYTAGLLGEQYVGLEPGGAEEFLQDGDKIDQTPPALVLEQLVGQLLFSHAEEGSE
jgi:phospholipid/cholesterol/gamma-HCH transport system substrate-binding protein